MGDKDFLKVLNDQEMVEFLNNISKRPKVNIMEIACQLVRKKKQESEGKEEEEEEYDDGYTEDDENNDSSPLKTVFSQKDRLKIQRGGLLATLSKLGKSLLISISLITITITSLTITSTFLGKQWRISFDFKPTRYFNTVFWS